MAGFDNDVVYGTNVNFSTANALGGAATILTNGQMLIGTTALNAGGTHINVGTLTSPDSSVLIGYSTPNITLQVAAGALSVLTLTPDVGGAISPTAGNINVLGYDTTGGQSIMDTHNVGASTMRIENRTWLTPFVVDPSATVGNRGTFQTIAAALTAAVSGQDIFIRTGTYTENLTLKAGVNLIAFDGDGDTPNVTIIGLATMTTAGTVTISGIRLQTNSNFFLAVTGSANSIVNLMRCFLNCSNNTGISFTSSGASAAINIFYSRGDIGTTGIKYFESTAVGAITTKFSDFLNTGASVTASTFTTGDFNIESCRINAPITFSGTADLALARNTIFFTRPLNVTALTLGGSSGPGTLVFCRVLAGTASAIVVTTNCSLFNCNIGSSNAAVISGAGTLHISGTTFTDNAAISTTTQKVDPFQPGATKVVLPAGNYTVLGSDTLVAVASAGGARTITLQAAPSNGQTHMIKDKDANALVNNITISGNGNNIVGLSSAATFVINTNGGSATLIFDTTNNVWYVV